MTCEIDGQPGVWMIIQRRPVGANEPWEAVADGCIGSENTVTLEEVTNAAEQELHEALGRPVAHADPGPRALVNLPVLFWTTDHGTQTLTIDEPLPGTITATPTYTWAFPGGRTATGVGTPYDGADPRRAPDHYLTHTFTSTGAAAATLAVDWAAAITVGANPAVDLDPVSFVTTTHLDVVESLTVLSDSWPVASTQVVCETDASASPARRPPPCARKTNRR